MSKTQAVEHSFDNISHLVLVMLYIKLVPKYKNCHVWLWWKAFTKNVSTLFFHFFSRVLPLSTTIKSTWRLYIAILYGVFEKMIYVLCQNFFDMTQQFK